jgi:hypothetical protein
MAARNISYAKLLTLPDDYLLVTKEVAAMAGRVSSTISNHRRAGLLPYLPGSPVKMRAGDVKVYLTMMDEQGKYRKRLHISMKIDPSDRRLYYPLSSITDFTSQGSRSTIEAVISETQSLWKRYQTLKQKDAKAA